MSVTFTPSQIPTTEDTSPLTFRLAPHRLLLNDLFLFLRIARYIPQIVLPFYTCNPNGELYLWNMGNIVSLVLHSVLIVCSLVGIFGAVIVWVFALGVAFFLYLAGVALACGICIFPTSKVS